MSVFIMHYNVLHVHHKLERTLEAGFMKSVTEAATIIKCIYGQFDQMFA